jgi:import receptor subunit TOM20
MKTSTIVSISVGTVVTGLLGECCQSYAPISELARKFDLTYFTAYAVYFDYKRRNDPEFRKQLKRESRRQARITREAVEKQGEERKEKIRAAVREAIEEGFTTDNDEREAFFMQQIAEGEQLAGEGTSLQDRNGTISRLSLTLVGKTGSDPIAAALCFYKALKVYPEPSSLISIYDTTVPKE